MITPDSKILKWLESIKQEKIKPFCDPGKDCNDCPLMEDTPYNRFLYKILSTANDKFGKEFYHHIKTLCPNLTCCPVCRVDDFTHIEDCWLDREMGDQEEKGPVE